MSKQSGIAMRLGLVETVKHWAKYLPDKPAMLFDTGVLCYRELYSAAMRTATEIVRVVPDIDVPIGLVADEKPAFVIGLLAILATGSSVVLLNPIWPDAVLAQSLADSGAKVVLVDSGNIQKRFNSQRANP